MTALERDACLHAIGDLRAAPSASSRRAVVQRLALMFERSEQTVYSWLKMLGWESGRATRSDKGRGILTPEDLASAAAMAAKARNKRGQANLPGAEIHRVAQEQGHAVGKVSYGHLLRQMNKAGLGKRQMHAPDAAISRVPTHPNQVWFFDISIAIQWYLREKETGKKFDQYSDGAARFYEGKRANLAAINRVLHRFAIVDAYSGAYFVQYRYTPGERAEDVIDFWYEAMALKTTHELAQAMPFRGLPEYLVMDQGSANKSGIVQSLLRELGIKAEYHAPGNAKASGVVETRHNHWQRTFEGRLRLSTPVAELGEINGLAARFCANANSERVHSRTLRAAQQRTPMQLWATITAEQLREAPTREVFFQLASATPRVGTLTNQLYLRADGRHWQISGVNVHPQQKVHYRISPFAANGIRVWDQWERELAAEEIRFDQVSGHALNGRLHRWGDEEAKGATAPSTPAQKLARAVAAEEVVVEVPTVFDNLDRQIARHAYLVPEGKAWAAQASPVAAEPLLGSLEAREEVVRRLGQPLTREEGAWWREATRDGVTASQLEELLITFTTGAATTARHA